MVKTTDYTEWLTEQKKNIDAKIYLKDYIWKNGKVEFKDEEMKNFEKEKAGELSS